MALCSSGTSISRLKRLLRLVFTCGMPQRNTKAVRKTHGNQAFHAPGAFGVLTSAARGTLGTGLALGFAFQNIPMITQTKAMIG